MDDELLKMDLEEMYELCEVLEEEMDDEEEEMFKQAKRGYKMGFPIQYIIHQYFEEKPETKGVRIFGFGYHNIIDFWEEVQTRKVILRKIIANHHEEVDAFMGRLTEERGAKVGSQ